MVALVSTAVRSAHSGRLEHLGRRRAAPPFEQRGRPACPRPTPRGSAVRPAPQSRSSTSVAAALTARCLRALRRRGPSSGSARSTAGARRPRCGPGRARRPGRGRAARAAGDRRGRRRRLGQSGAGRLEIGDGGRVGHDAPGDAGQVGEAAAPLSSSPKVSDMMSSSWWASSMTTTSCSGSRAPPGLEVEAVEVGVDHHDVGRRRPGRRAASAKQARPAGSWPRPGTPRGPTLTAAQARSRGLESSSARSPVAVVAAHAASRSHLLAGRRPRSVQASVSWASPASGLPHPLEAQVVGPTLEHGQGERPLRGARPGRAGPCRPAGPAGPWWRWRPPPWPAATARPAPGRPATCRCPCRPGRPGGGRRSMARPTASAISTWPGRASPAGQRGGGRGQARHADVGRHDRGAAGPSPARPVPPGHVEGGRVHPGHGAAVASVDDLRPARRTVRRGRRGRAAGSRSRCRGVGRSWRAS